MAELILAVDCFTGDRLVAFLGRKKADETNSEQRRMTSNLQRPCVILNKSDERT